MNVEITIYSLSGTKDVNMYIATYIHQQLVGNSNYINNAIIVNCDTKSNGVYRTIINIDPEQLDDHIPNIAIDWQAIDHIEIDAIKPDIAYSPTKIVNSIESRYVEYPVIANYDFGINYVGSKIYLYGRNVPHMVFNFADWFKKEVI